VSPEHWNRVCRRRRRRRFNVVAVQKEVIFSC
jgi:hypothetical protein